MIVNMIPSSKFNLAVFLLILSVLQSLAYTEVSDEPTAYEMLKRYNFPVGVFPQGVKSYLLRKDGSFDVYLVGDCEFKVAGYLLKYKKRVSGTVEVGSISKLSGVSVKILFFYLGINQVVVNGDQLSFYVGPLSASFPLSNFDESPQCRSGFDWQNRLVSDS